MNEQATATTTQIPNPGLWTRMNTPLSGPALRRAKVFVAINAIGWAIAIAYSAGHLIGVLGTIASLR